MRIEEQRRWVFPGVLFVYILLTLVMTYPVVARLDTHLIGNGDDMWVHYWNNWWVKRVLQQGGSVYHTSLLFHPTGVSLLFHNFAWINVALWLALEPIFGGIAAYNLTHLIHIPLCGLGMFSLVRYLTKSDAAAFLSGLIYAFWPHRMLHVNHPNVVSTEAFPFLMLVLLRLFEGRKPIREGLIAGLLVALIGYIRLQFLILAGFMIGLYLLYTLAWERRRWNRRRALGLALMAAISVALTSIILYPPLRGQLVSGLPKGTLMANFGSEKQDLMTYVAPQQQHPLSPMYDRLFTSYASASARGRYSAFPGHIVLTLLILGMVRQSKQARTKFWLGLALLCFALALGPQLRFRRISYDIPMPYRLVGWLPPFKLLGPPRRFNALLSLPIAILAAWGALGLRDWLARRRWANWVARPAVFAALLGGVLLLDYLSVPTDTILAHVPRFYATLAEKPDDLAVVGLPGTRKQAEYYMFYQTVHGHPVLSGHVSRLPPEALEFASSVPLLSGMYETGEIDTSLPDVSHQLSLLAQAGFQYAIIHKDFLSPEQLAEWRSYFVISPRYEDEETIVYAADPVVGRDYSLRYKLGDGVGLIDASLSPETVHPDASLELQVVWGATAPPGGERQLEVALVDEKGNVDQTEYFAIAPSWPPEKWSANEIVHDMFSFPVEPWLSEGEHTVTLRLLRGKDRQEMGQPIVVGEITMLAPKRSFSAPTVGQEAQVDFGSALHLLGYDLRQDEGRLMITLHWRAMRRMETDYKFFLHLHDAESGALTAQVDVMPRDWAYPTSWWEANEVVSDEITLPLKELPSGRYRLWVGAYCPEDGKRLTIGDAPSDFVAENGRLRLPQSIVR